MQRRLATLKIKLFKSLYTLLTAFVFWLGDTVWFLTRKCWCSAFKLNLQNHGFFLVTLAKYMFQKKKKKNQLKFMCGEKICHLLLLKLVFYIFISYLTKTHENAKNLICKYSLSEINRQIRHSNDGLKIIANFHVNFS